MQAIPHKPQKLLSSQFESLNAMILSFEPGDLITIASRPSIGKTAFLLNLVLGFDSVHKAKGLVFSLELAKEDLVRRLLGLASNVNTRPGYALSKSAFNAIQAGAKSMSSSKIFLDDSPNISEEEICRKSIELKHKDGLDYIALDYLQLITSGRKSKIRSVEIADISRTLKNLARELGVPIFLLSQLHRGAEFSGPQLTHLLDAGAIEGDADIILLMSRFRNPSFSTENLVQFHLAKHRRGPTGTFALEFDRATMRFTELDWRSCTGS